MADLRKAAEEVLTLWSQGAESEDAEMAIAMSDLSDAISEPDPVAEAREIIRLLPDAFNVAAHWIEACPFENAIPHAERLRSLEVQSREWLRRNGG